jgi:hypothetical protein
MYFLLLYLLCIGEQQMTIRCQRSHRKENWITIIEEVGTNNRDDTRRFRSHTRTSSDRNLKPFTNTIARMGKGHIP